MPIHLDASNGEPLVQLDGILGPEEAEELLEKLLDNPAAKLDLESCEHLHAAVLQVVLAANYPVAAWPQDSLLHQALKAALAGSGAAAATAEEQAPEENP